MRQASERLVFNPVVQDGEATQHTRQLWRDDAERERGDGGWTAAKSVAEIEKERQRILNLSHNKSALY